MVKMVHPSKTAQNGLNFLTEELEKEMRNSDNHHDVLAIFESVAVLLNKSNKDLLDGNAIEYVFNNILPRYGVPNISKLY